MEVTAFYGVVAGLGGTVLALWWVVTGQHPQWFVQPARRRMAYIVSLHFMLPAFMALLSFVDPESTGLWQAVFAICAVAGMVGAVLVTNTIRQDFGRARLASVAMLVALPVYLAVGIFALWPELAWRMFGAEPLQVEAFLLAIVLALGMHAAWFMATEPPADPPAAPASPAG